MRLQFRGYHIAAFVAGTLCLINGVTAYARDENQIIFALTNDDVRPRNLAVLT